MPSRGDILISKWGVEGWGNRGSESGQGGGKRDGKSAPGRQKSRHKALEAKGCSFERPKSSSLGLGTLWKGRAVREELV